MNVNGGKQAENSVGPDEVEVEQKHSHEVQG